MSGPGAASLTIYSSGGTPDQVASQAAALFEVDARRVEASSPHGLTNAQGLHLLGEQVLTALRAYVDES